MNARPSRWLVVVFWCMAAVCSVFVPVATAQTPLGQGGGNLPAAATISQNDGRAPSTNVAGTVPLTVATIPHDASVLPGTVKEKVIREQTIYIPYEKLRKVFEKEGRGVFLPYEKFQELWQAAQEKRETVPEQKPPVAAVITASENEAIVSKDVVRVKAVLKIEVIKEGWNEIPLRLADAAITEATIGGRPARILSAGGEGYKLLMEKTDKKPEQIELTLHYAKAVTKSPGQNSVSFEAPQAAVSRWKVRIPEAGIKVHLQPLIAATEAASDGAIRPEPRKSQPASKPEATKPTKPITGANETVILAFVGAAPNVRIDWTPKAEGATGLEALASVQAEEQVTVGEGVTRTRVQLAYSISRAELRQLAIEVPAGQKVVNVFDPNVRQWSVEQPGAAEKAPGGEPAVGKSPRRRSPRRRYWCSSSSRQNRPRTSRSS